MMRELAIETAALSSSTPKSNSATRSSVRGKLSSIPNLSIRTNSRRDELPVETSYRSSFASTLASPSEEREDFGSLGRTPNGAPITECGANEYLASMLGDLHMAYEDFEPGSSELELSEDSGVHVVDRPSSTESMDKRSSHQIHINDEEGLATQGRHRLRAVQEILDTEVTYVDMLASLNSLVIDRLREQAGSGKKNYVGYNSDDVSQIACNLSEILGLHRTLLMGLHERY
jgi:hypothetical protein